MVGQAFASYQHNLPSCCNQPKVSSNLYKISVWSSSKLPLQAYIQGICNEGVLKHLRPVNFLILKAPIFLLPLHIAQLSALVYFSNYVHFGYKQIMKHSSCHSKHCFWLQQWKRYNKVSFHYHTHLTFNFALSKQMFRFKMYITFETDQFL